MVSPYKFGCIVLAGGQSTRMGDENKLLVEFNNQPMIVQTVSNIPPDAFAQIVVVTGYQAECIEKALAGKGFTFAHNKDFQTGLSSSLKAGLTQLDRDIDGVLVMLGDMPLVDRDTISQLVKRFEFRDDICVPVFNKQRGNPVLWGRDYFDEMCQLNGDVGAKVLLEKYGVSIKKVSVDNQSVLRDFDTKLSLNIMHT